MRAPGLACASAVFGLSLSAGSPTKVRVEGFSPIPAEAQLVCQARVPGERSDSGFPATEIFVADADGNHRTQITRQRKLYNHVAVSPDRTQVAAGRYDHGDTNGDGRVNSRDQKTLVVLDLASKQEWAPVPGFDDQAMGGVDWTPDGQWIVASMRNGRRIDIYRVHPDGSGLENLTQDLGKLVGGPKPAMVSDVSVSFDGQWITFLAANSEREPTRIAVMKMDRSEAHYVTDGGGARAQAAGGMWGKGDYDPEFSPDGQYISFQRSTNAKLSFGFAPSYDVYRVKIDGTDLKRLSREGNKAVLGVTDWSKDNRIVFSEWNGEERWVGPVMVNADGSNYHRIEKLKGCTWVRWIPK